MITELEEVAAIEEAITHAETTHANTLYMPQLYAIEEYIEELRKQLRTARARATYAARRAS